MTEHKRVYLLDAAKQLEAAARRVKRVGEGGEYSMVCRRLMREARANINAALARMDAAGDDLTGD